MIVSLALTSTDRMYVSLTFLAISFNNVELLCKASFSYESCRNFTWKKYRVHEIFMCSNVTIEMKFKGTCDLY